MMRYSMAAELFINKITKTFSIISNQLAYLAKLHSRLACFYRNEHRFSRYFAKFVNFWMYFDIFSF